MALLDTAVQDAPPALDDAPETTVAGAPEAPDTNGAADVSTDGPDEEAMAAFLGVFEDEAGHDAATAADDVTPGADGAPGEEPLTPAQQAALDKKLKAADRDYTQKSQSLAEQRRQFEQERREFEAQRAAQAVRAQQEPAAPAPAVGKPMTIEDCMDEDGSLDVAKFKQYEAQRDAALEARITGTYIKPVTDKLTAREQAEADQTMVAEEKRLRGEFETATKAFPHFADSEDVQRAVLQHMAENRIRSFRAAYADLYPAQFAAAVTAYQQAVARKKQSGGQGPPATPPGRQAKTNQVLPGPDDEDARLDAMARRASQLSGVPLRDEQ